VYHDFRALDPSKYLDEVSPGRTATIVIAAVDSSLQSRAQADFVCDGVNDHVEIQAALDALPATGGEVMLLDGTYNIEVSLVLDSYQTLRGQGRNTILTSNTADLIFLSAVGGAGTELTEIVIADLQIDGGAGGVSDCGIYFEYVDYSFIQNVFLRRHASGTGSYRTGIYLLNSDFNTIIGNTCLDNDWEGIWLDSSNNNVITGNISQGNGEYGIWLDVSNNNVISGNTCQGNGWDGIELSGSDFHTVTGNTCQDSGEYGIWLDISNNNVISGNISRGSVEHGAWLGTSNNNVITGNIFQGSGKIGIYLFHGRGNSILGNTCIENSQRADNTHDNIEIFDSYYTLIEGNLCRAPTIGTTLTVGEPIAETEIAVTNTAGFEVGMGVVIDLGGGNEEYHRIVAITAGAPGVIVIDAGLTNAQGAGETIDVPEARYGINVHEAASDKNVVVGNDLYDSGKTANFNDVGTCTLVADDNRDIEITQIKHLRWVEQTSGGALVVGDVVSLKAVAAGNEVTTPAAIGEDQVYGMLAENIADSAYGYVQVKGGTVLLKATNAGGNIVVGDFLCTEAGGTRARLAGAGDQVFARALEACAVADLVIDAYIKSPWD